MSTPAPQPSTLVVGTDSYITAADADTYVAGYYISTDPKAVAWAALKTADKDILLRRAARQIDLVPFPGQLSGSSQAMAWPRTVQNWGNGWFQTIAPFTSFQLPTFDYSNVVFGDNLNFDPTKAIPALVQ
ncbi:MAG: hypothetical protein P4N59_25235, partial [Negativicutes bacterium]|nr:hypothetical protein [Negativicutes bacterium]